MASLDDQEYLAFTKIVNQFIRPADVRDDGQSLGLLVKQDRVVRRDELGAVIADQYRPRVLADQLADHVRVSVGVSRVVAQGTGILAARGRPVPSRRPIRVTSRVGAQAASKRRRGLPWRVTKTS